MDEVLARKLLRQIKLLNFFLVFFAAIFLVVFAVAGVFAYKAVQEVRDARESITSVRESVQVKNQLCDSSSSLAALLQEQTDVCSAN